MAASQLIDRPRLSDWFGAWAALDRRFYDPLGDGSEALVLTLDGALLPGSPSFGDVFPVHEAIPAIVPPNGTLAIAGGSLDVVFTSVVAGKTLYVEDVSFACVASGATGDQFNVGGSDTLTAAAFCAAFNASTDVGIAGVLHADHVGATVTLSPLLLTDQVNHRAYGDTCFVRTKAVFGIEYVRYQSWSGSNFTVQGRGVDGTEPQGHMTGAYVYLPSSASRIALYMAEIIYGDGVGTLLGVGGPSYYLLEDLITSSRENIQNWTNSIILGRIGSDAINALEAHIGIRGTELTGTPSYGKTPITTVNELLRYYNDPETGILYSIPLPYRAGRFYYFAKGGGGVLSSGGLLLDNKIVEPLPTVLGTFVIASDSSVVFTPGTALNRYGTLDPAVFDPGYMAQRIQLRVVLNGTGKMDVALMCQGQGGTRGMYYGRPKSASMAVVGPINGEPVTINGIAFTFTTGTPSTLAVAIGASNAATADNFAAAFANAAATYAPAMPALSGIDCTALSGIVNFARANPNDDMTNYPITTDSATRLPLSAGTLTGQTVVTFGGGAGPNIPPDGLGADSDQTYLGAAVPANADNPRTFDTVLSGPLDLTAVGNTAQLLNLTSRKDRVHAIVSATADALTYGGANATVIVETVPVRAVT